MNVSTEALLGVDVGGTFTDATLVSGGRLHTAKVPTTPADQSIGVMRAVEGALAHAGVGASAVVRFGHGMTVGTNALLEERGARTALLATEGFVDVIEIARQARPDLYRLCSDRPRPLVPPELRFGVRERTGPGGVIEPLEERELAPLMAALEAAGVESVAVSLLHSYADPRHERRLEAAVRERMAGVHVSSSNEVESVFREYERTSTTVIDAYLSPLLARYIERLAERARSLGLAEPEIMLSSGGVLPAVQAARHGAWTVLSGPAAGAVGAARLGSLAGHEDVLSFDMGGTSCDVGVVDGGRVRLTAGRALAGRPLQLPMVDVHTVGAGGGSIGWADAGGALRVGPQSAGAEPGPACYGAGGSEATVTDATLALGYLAPGGALAGGIALDAEAAERALRALGRSLDLSVEETAAGIVRVADQEMLRALRVVTVERGIDPRSYALVAFGGAGPMHAARIADELGVASVLCPRAAGVLSALGLVVSDRRRDVARSVLLAGPELSAQALARVVDELTREATAALPAARIEVVYELRYRGQAFELPIPGPPACDPERLRADFERAHDERYGFADPSAELELVNVRVAAIEPGARPALEAEGGGVLEQGTRLARFDGRRVETTVMRGALPAHTEVEGPAICELPEATVVVPPGWSGSVHPDGTLALERRERP